MKGTENHLEHCSNAHHRQDPPKDAIIMGEILWSGILAQFEGISLNIVMNYHGGKSSFTVEKTGRWHVIKANITTNETYQRHEPLDILIYIRQAHIERHSIKYLASSF